MAPIGSVSLAVLLCVGFAFARGLGKVVISSSFASWFLRCSGVGNGISSSQTIHPLVFGQTRFVHNFDLSWVYISGA